MSDLTPTPLSSPSEEPTPQSDKHKHSALREVLSWVLVVVVAFVAATLLQTFVVVNATVPTGSMLNSIQEGDRVMASRLSYISSNPERGDIAIFRFPDDESKLYVKRVIGLPGDTVLVRDGKVYINGADQPLAEPYVTESSTGDYGPYQVPADHYFMMGDNRDNSQDSRFWQNTYVEKEKILGKVVFRYFPNWTWFGGEPSS